MSDTQDYLLRLRELDKAFPGIRALSDVSFDVRSGEVLALVGENGAGKSTLIKILGGLFPPDAGQILFDGRVVRFRNAHQAQLAGISVIYQEFNLMPELTVAENIFVGREPSRLGWLNGKQLRRDAAALLERLGVVLDPMGLVADLSVAQKQMVEIAKALSFQAKLLVMDEPTAALSDKETEKLFTIARHVKAAGMSVLFVSHRLQEVFAIADRITVLRDGRVIGTRDATQTDQAEIVRLMVGRDIGTPAARADPAAGEPILAVRGATVAGQFEEVTFEVRRGEILGIAGLMGSGRTQLAEALYGLWPLDGGRILFEGREVSLRHPAEAIALGIGFLSEDRKSGSLFPELSVLHNLTMSSLRRLSGRVGAVLDFPRERDCLEHYTARLDIRCRGASQEIAFLSGGNQQKVLLARLLATRSRLLILCEPTRGVDVGAKAEIHRFMGGLAQKGLAIILISSDLPELISLSDRCLVMHAGRISGRLDRSSMIETNIVGCATGQQELA